MFLRHFYNESCCNNIFFRLGIEYVYKQTQYPVTTHSAKAKMSGDPGMNEFKLMVKQGVQELDDSKRDFIANKTRHAQEMMDGTVKEIPDDTPESSECGSDDEFCQCEGDLVLVGGEGRGKGKGNTHKQSSKASVLRMPSTQTGPYNRAPAPAAHLHAKNENHTPKQPKHTKVEKALFKKDPHPHATQSQAHGHGKPIKHGTDAHVHAAHNAAVHNAMKAVEKNVSKPHTTNKVAVVMPRKIFPSTGEKSVCTTESKSHAMDFYDYLMKTSLMVGNHYKDEPVNETRKMLIQAILNHGMIAHDKLRSKIATDYFAQIQTLRMAKEMADITNGQEIESESA